MVAATVGGASISDVSELEEGYSNIAFITVRERFSVMSPSSSLSLCSLSLIRAGMDGSAGGVGGDGRLVSGLGLTSTRVEGVTAGGSVAAGCSAEGMSRG